MNQQNPRTRTNPVKITRADGTVEYQRGAQNINRRKAIPRNLLARVILRDGGHCRYCAFKPWHPQIDHVIPVAHGGKTELDNLVVACERCNRSKGTEHWKPLTLQQMWEMKRANIKRAQARRREGRKDARRDGVSWNAYDRDRAKEAKRAKVVRNQSFEAERQRNALHAENEALWSRAIEKDS